MCFSKGYRPILDAMKSFAQTKDPVDIEVKFLLQLLQVPNFMGSITATWTGLRKACDNSLQNIQPVFLKIRNKRQSMNQIESSRF